LKACRNTAKRGDLVLDSLLSFFQSESSFLEVLLAISSLDDSLSLIGVLNFSLLGGLLGGGSGVLSDFFVNLSVELFQRGDTSLLEVGFPLAELSSVSFLIVFLQLSHVLFNVETKDSFSVSLGVVGFLATFTGVAGESLGGVGDVEATVASTLEDTENSVTGGGSDETSIQNSLEGSLFSSLVVVGDIVVFTVSLLGTSVDLVQTSLVEESSGDEEASGVASSVVGQTRFETESLEFSGVSGSEDSVTLDGGIDDLGNNSGASDSGNKSVLGGVVLVLILDDKGLSGVVVSLSLSSSSESSLESLEVSSGLVNFNESLIER
jgi:hypothetical protein